MPKVTPRTKAWKSFSRYVRLRDSLKTTGTKEYCVCVTCGRTKSTFTGHDCIQAGHFVPGRTNAILFDEECTNGQCYGCNCGQGGMWVEYEDVMVKRYGAEKTAEMKLRKHRTVKYDAAAYKEIELKYKAKFEELENERNRA